MRLFHLLWLFILWLKMEKSLQMAAIKCKVPLIENGNVPGDTQEYNEHEVLHFACNPNYMPSDRRPTTCTIQRGRAEWIPTPYCETTKCRLTLPPLEGTSYEPAYRNVFSPGDTVKVICGERYWISNPQNTSAIVTCNDDGDWTVRPLCREVTCSNRRDPLVDNWYVKRITLNGTARYTCRSGYRSTDGTNLATCTRDGWRPNPLCQEAKCQIAGVPDNVRIITDDPNNQVRRGQKLRFACRHRGHFLRGKAVVECLADEQWSAPFPTCGDPLGCNNPPPLTDGVIKESLRFHYSHNERVEYICRNPYQMEGEPYLTCVNGEWSGKMRCHNTAYCNSPPRVENAFVVSTYKNKYLSDSEVTYQCHDDYTMVGENTLRCREGEWEKKNLNCKSMKCRLTLPPLEGTSYEPAYRNVFSPDEQVTVTCGEKYWITSPRHSSAVTTCADSGEWTIRPVCKEVTCSNQRPQHVYSWNVYWGQKMILGDTARYRCRANYTSPDGSYMATCTRDGWRPNPLCQAHHCPVIHVNDNVQVNGSLERAAHGNVVRFSCKSNTDILFGPTEIYCNESGLWSGDAPKCQAIKCRLTLPPLEGTSYEPVYRNVFSPDEQVTVTCGEKYWITSPQHSSAVTTCADYGEWTIRPVCKEVTCSNQRPQHVYSWNVYWGQKIILGDTARYRCRANYKSPDGSYMATCTRDGWRPNPLCQEITCEREDIPHANIVSPKLRYTNNQRADYECEEGYKGRPTRTCGEYGWTGDSQCTEITCEREDIPHANIVNPKLKYTNNQRADYECEEGYKGRPTRTCGEYGWTGDSQCTGAAQEGSRPW
ncbi:complement factor H-like isoform 2-T2 [Acanthopagrus schlegelii]